MTEIEDPKISDGLCNLTALAAVRGYETAAGFLGGEFGYGAHIDNTVFEMHPYWWGDCECGHDKAELMWETVHPHGPNCYQTELSQRGDDMEAAEQLAKEWGLPVFGCASHCTCGADKAFGKWSEDHRHSLKCPVVRPNFAYKRAGLEIRWYKYIGRSMESNRPIGGKEWPRIMKECAASLTLQKATVV